MSHHSTAHNSATNKLNLLDYTQEELATYLTSIGEKPFRAAQIVKWVHQIGATDFMAMTNISLQLRQHLQEHAVVEPPHVLKHLTSQDGTQKWLLQLHDRTVIETVFIPEKDRGTLCISTQVGCPMGCAFCATGKLGFKRNLTLGEIIGQVWLAVRELAPDKTTRSHAVTNVVIMGMGEPLLNFDNVVKAIALMRSDLAYGLSKYRVTLSTVGLTPEIRRLSKLTDVALALSLHATTDELRNKLIPISKKYPLKELIQACKEFYHDRRRKVTFEYTMIDGVNDTVEDAKRLVRLVGNINCKVNLIPCNPVADGTFHPSSQTRIDRFRNILMAADINTITRKTRGADIAAACGQLAGSDKSS
jgi:23S rRNA (adenine2503-C2)-methyltransferase